MCLASDCGMSEDGVSHLEPPDRCGREADLICSVVSTPALDRSASCVAALRTVPDWWWASAAAGLRVRTGDEAAHVIGLISRWGYASSAFP